MQRDCFVKTINRLIACRLFAHLRRCVLLKLLPVSKEQVISISTSFPHDIPDITRGGIANWMFWPDTMTNEYRFCFVLSDPAASVSVVGPSFDFEGALN